MPERIGRLLKSPAPTNISELISLLGIMNYYQKHLNQVETTLEPLHHPLYKGVTWKWELTEHEAFKQLK